MSTTNRMAPHFATVDSGKKISGMLSTMDAPTKLAALASFAIIDVIKEQGDEGAPAGAIVAALQSKGMAPHIANALIQLIVDTGAVRRENHVLYWVGAEGLTKNAGDTDEWPTQG